MVILVVKSRKLTVKTVGAVPVLQIPPQKTLKLA